MSSSATTHLPSAIDSDLESGQVVSEYRIDGKLGQGAFGTVYKAVHPLIDKVVAIKVLARRYSVDPEMVSRFIAEARAVNQIRHRNIIDIFSFGALDDGRQYYVMEYLDGEPLDALIDRDGKLPLARALPILRGIAKALDAAHAKGVTHRDLKAENVFLAGDADGGVFPKLLDFGIAKLLAPDDGLKHKTRTGLPIGTPYYMSPEQCRGRDVDHRTDHYAFGVLCYRMLTGVYPFDADDHMSILMQQVNADPQPPSTHAPELTPAIDRVVLWLLAKEPAERPPDLRTAVRALDPSVDMQTGPSALAMQPPVTLLPSHTPARSSRTPMIAGLVAAALIVGAGIYIMMQPDAAPATAALPAAAPPVGETQPAAARPATPQIDVAPEAPVSVIVTVRGVPEGTEVLAAGAVIGVAPGPVQIARGDAPLVLTFRSDGHVAASKTIVPDADQELAVALKRKARARGGKATRDDIIDVFGGKQ